MTALLSASALGFTEHEESWSARVGGHGVSFRLVRTVDEENISEGAAVLARSGWLDDVAAILVPEGPQPERRLDLTLGRRGRVTIDVHVGGLPAHAAFPDQGESALLRAATVALALQRLEPATHPQLVAGGGNDPAVRLGDGRPVDPGGRQAHDRSSPGAAGDHCVGGAGDRGPC